MNYCFYLTIIYHTLYYFLQIKANSYCCIFTGDSDVVEWQELRRMIFTSSARDSGVPAKEVEDWSGLVDYSLRIGSFGPWSFHLNQTWRTAVFYWTHVKVRRHNSPRAAASRRRSQVSLTTVRLRHRYGCRSAADVRCWLKHTANVLQIRK